MLLSNAVSKERLRNYNINIFKVIKYKHKKCRIYIRKNILFYDNFAVTTKIWLKHMDENF